MHFLEIIRQQCMAYDFKIEALMQYSQSENCMCSLLTCNIGFVVYLMKHGNYCCLNQNHIPFSLL